MFGIIVSGELKFLQLNRIYAHNVQRRFFTDKPERIEAETNKNDETDFEKTSLESRVRQLKDYQRWVTYGSSSTRRWDKKPKLNDGFGNFDKILNRHDMLDRNSYWKLCNEITSNACTSLKLLPLVPAICMRFKDERYFVNNLLENWWSLLSNNFQWFRRSDLSRTVYNLQQINGLTEGAVLKKIGWECIENLTEQFLKDIGNGVSLGSFTLILDGLRKFTTNTDVRCSPFLLNSLSRSFELYLSSSTAEKFIDEQTKIIGRTLYLMAVLGVEKPSKNCQKLFIPLCENSLHYSKVVGNVWYFMNTNRMAEAFLIWDINPNKFIPGFWSSFFEAVEYNYNILTFVMEAFSAAILKNTLLVAMKFKEEKNFLKIQRIWLRELSKIIDKQNTKLSTPSQVCIDCMKEIRNVLTNIKDTSTHSGQFKLLANQNVIDKIDTMLTPNKTM